MQYVKMQFLIYTFAFSSRYDYKMHFQARVPRINLEFVFGMGDTYKRSRKLDLE